MPPNQETKKASPETIDFVIDNQRHIQETLFGLKAIIEQLVKTVEKLPDARDWGEMVKTLENHNQRIRTLEDYHIEVLKKEEERRSKRKPAIINTSGMNWWHWLSLFFVLLFTIALIVS